MISTTPGRAMVNANGETEVEKGVEMDGDAVARIEFAIRSLADTVATVRIADPLPASWPTEEVACHPDYEPERWTVDDGSVVYEHEIAPGTVHETLYAIKIEDERGLDAFRVPPVVDIERGERVTDESMDGGQGNSAPDRVAASGTAAETGDARGRAEEADAHGKPARNANERVDAVDSDGSRTDIDDVTRGSALDRPTEQPPDDRASQLSADGSGPELVAPSLESRRPIEGGERNTTRATAETGQSDAERKSVIDEGACSERRTDRGTAHRSAGSGTGASTGTPASSTESSPGTERPTGTGASSSPPPADPGKLLEAVVHALRTQATPEQRAVLREEVGVAGHTSLSLRVDHLEREHSEIAAYTDALRAFLDSKGGAREILESLQAEQMRLESQIEELVDRLDQTDGLEDELATIAGRLDELDGELGALQQSMADIGDEIEATMAWQSAVQESFAELGGAPPE